MLFEQDPQSKQCFVVGSEPDLEDYGGEAADFGQDGHGIASVGGSTLPGQMGCTPKICRDSRSQ